MSPVATCAPIPSGSASRVVTTALGRSNDSNTVVSAATAINGLDISDYRYNVDMETIKRPNVISFTVGSCAIFPTPTVTYSGMTGMASQTATVADCVSVSGSNSSILLTFQALF